MKFSWMTRVASLHSVISEYFTFVLGQYFSEMIHLSISLTMTSRVDNHIKLYYNYCTHWPLIIRALPCRRASALARLVLLHIHSCWSAKLRLPAVPAAPAPSPSSLPVRENACAFTIATDRVQRRKAVASPIQPSPP